MLSGDLLLFFAHRARFKSSKLYSFFINSFDFGTFSINHPFKIEFFLYFFTAIIRKYVLISFKPKVLSAFPALLAIEKDIHDGLPIINSESGSASISETLEESLFQNLNMSLIESLSR